MKQKGSIIMGILVIVTLVIGIGIDYATKEVVNTTSSEVEELATQYANSTLNRYAGNRVRGSTVKTFIEYIEALNENKVFPTNIIIEYAEGISETTISNSEYYKVEIEDRNNDQYYDTVIISYVD